MSWRQLGTFLQSQQQSRRRKYLVEWTKKNVVDVWGQRRIGGLIWGNRKGKSSLIVITKVCGIQSLNPQHGFRCVPEQVGHKMENQEFTPAVSCSFSKGSPKWDESLDLRCDVQMVGLEFGVRLWSVVPSGLDSIWAKPQRHWIKKNNIQI